MKKLKILVSVILALMLLAALAVFMTTALATDSEDTYSENKFLYFDHRSVFRDPIRITTSDGRMYEPQSYVYFGEVYNSVTGEYEPILARVLDADKDNVGGSGAMFLLAEEAIVLNQKFAYDEDNNGIAFDNIYTQSAINDIDASKFFSPEEIKYIRKMTKTDFSDDMMGMFGYDENAHYNWRTESFDGFEIISVDSVKILNESYIFPLSAEELSKYVADHSGADALIAFSFEVERPVSWWLRTAIDSSYNTGDQVGAVGENGRVYAETVWQSEVAFRPAFNLEYGNISYVQEVEANTYRLAFHTDKADGFNASAIFADSGVVTVRYTNAPIDTTPDDGKTPSISIVIMDTEENVKHYEVIASVAEASGEVSFTLPEDLDHDFDRLYVFWEDKADNNKSVSFTGELIDLGVIHEYNNGICRGCGKYAEPSLNNNGTDTDAADDYYVINNAGNLYWFSEQVNGGNTGINGKLNANIVVNENLLNADGDSNGSGFRAWTPIGNVDNKYCGIFDGGNHTVSGLYYNKSDGLRIGLFGDVEKGSVLNVGVVDSYFRGQGFIGGVVGINRGGIVKNCYNKGTVSAGSWVGGVVGKNAEYGIVESCYSTGRIISNSSYLGGVLGDNGDTCTVLNCYYLDSTASGGIEQEDAEGVAEAKTAEQFASGHVAYLLGEAYGQNIGSDEAPVLGGAGVYYGYLACSDAEKLYTNYSNASEAPIAHNYENGICASNGCYEPAFLNGESYEIGNAGQLLWFAELVNAGNYGINAVLLNDIEMDGINWVPIGTKSAYEGIFDGHDFAINDLWRNTNGGDGARNGLFTEIGSAGIVKDLILSNATIWGADYCDMNSTAGIAMRNAGTISRCIIIGGSIQQGAYEYLGGIAGQNSGTIENCAVINVSFTRRWGGTDSGSMGGITQTNNGTVKNCFTYGCSFTNGHEDKDAVVARGNAPENCYYYTTSNVACTYGTSMTLEEFESGEVADLLGEAWVQGENYPTLICTKGCDSFTYTIFEDGTHARACVKCGYTVIEEHVFVDSKCVCEAETFVFEGKTYIIVGDVTYKGFIRNGYRGNYLNGYRAGEGYLLICDEDNVILYNATIDIRGNESIASAIQYASGNTDSDSFSISFFGTNYIYSGTDAYAIYFASEAVEITENKIIGADGAVLNVYGLVQCEAITFEGGTVNLYGESSMGSSLMCSSLTVKENTVVNAISRAVVFEEEEGSIQTPWIGILVTEGYTVEGILNGMITQNLEGNVVKYVAFGNVIAERDFVIDPAIFDGIGIEGPALVIPEGASVTIPEGYKIDITKFNEVDIKGELIVYGEVICDHRGVATCTHKAVCDICKQPYGDLDATNHASDDLKYSPNNDGTHNELYACCEGLKNENVACAGGTATCVARAICSLCAKEYGETLVHSHTNDFKFDDENHWNECECGDKASVAPHEDSDNDERCDTCGYDMPNTSTDSEESESEESESDDVNTDVGSTDESDTDKANTDENNGLGTGAIVGIAVGAVAVIGLGGFAIFRLVIRKKRSRK